MSQLQRPQERLELVTQPSTIDSKQKPNTNTTEETWEAFWTLWPKERRVCKKEARAQWWRMSMQERYAALEGLANWLPVWQARGEYEYVQHPHRWLRNARYEDEPPQMNGNGHASHALASLPAEVFVKDGIPPKVKSLLDKLKGRK